MASASLFFLVLGLFTISTVLSSTLENPATLTQVKEESEAVAPIEIPSISETEPHAEDDEKEAQPTDSAFLYTYYEGQYCSFTNNNHNQRRCRNKNQCCYCGGLGGQICQSICQKENPNKFKSSSCDRCRCTCQYSK